MGTLLALTLFGSVIWFWVVVAVFIIICFASDVNENGFFAFGTLVVLSVLFYFKANIDPLLDFFALPNILIYFGIGLGFSFLRTFFSARTLGHKINESVIEWKESKHDDEFIERNKVNEKNYFLKELKGNVFRWWFMWPISLLTWIATDIVKDVYDYIYSKMGGFYNWIVDLGMKSVK